jgi:hypothetical protein
MNPALQAVIFFAACTVAGLVGLVCGVTGLLGARPVVAVVGGLGAAVSVHVTVLAWRFCRASQGQQMRAPDNDGSADG